MAYVTIKERVVAYLVAMGKQRVLCSSKKYEKYRGGDTGVYYFVGENGSVRLSSDGKFAGSMDVKQRILERVKEWEQSQVYYVFDKEIGF